MRNLKIIKLSKKILNIFLKNKEFEYFLTQNAFFRLLYSKIPEKVLWKLSPVSQILIEASSFCNLKCPFCTQWRTERKKTHLSLENFKDIVKKLPSTISRITLHFSGESFMNTGLAEMIEYLSKKGIYSLICSNGTLPFARYKEVIDAGLSELTITLDGVTKEKHEKHRIGSNFNEVLDNLYKISKIKGRKTKLIIQTIATRENEEDLKKLIRLSKEIGIDELLLKTLSLNISSDEVIEKQRLKNARGFLPKNNALSRYIINGKNIKLKKPRVVCPEIRVPVITAEGDVVLCCIDLERTVKIGNIFEERSFFELWTSKKYKKIRKKALFIKLEVCKKCNYTLIEPPTIKIKKEASS